MAQHPRFGDKTVSFQLCSCDLLQQSELESSRIRNFSQFVFRVWPKLNFDSHLEYLEVKGQLDRWLNKYERSEHQ